MSTGLYVHALRAARARQLAARATRTWRRRRFPDAPPRPLRPLVENEPLWRSRAFTPLGAAPEAGSRLAAFHRHYGDDVLELARTGGDAAGAAARWIAANPPQIGDGWHPYPLSTRVANWIAASTLDERVEEAVRESLARQVAYLSRNVEDDVLGNHVLRNAKALLLAGAAAGVGAWLRQGRALLARELPEQVLADGGHYERSPAYHRLVLRDLLEVRAFAPVEREVARMTAFAAASSRPDGAPALFNDGGIDIAPALDVPQPAHGLSVFRDTGYVFLRDGDLWLAFDCGPPSPPFLPAHAHADALSLQLWWRGRPVLVDTGTSTYERGARRAYERGTAAHSTVAVGGDQFRVWGAFRSGPLPRVELLEATERVLRAVAFYDSVVHERTVVVGDASVTVADRVDGAGERGVVSTLLAAPDAPARLDGEPEPREVAERFGERAPATAWLVRRRAQLPIELRRRIELEG